MQDQEAVTGPDVNWYPKVEVVADPSISAEKP